MPNSRTHARQVLAQANEGEYRDIVLDSEKWDTRVEEILDHYTFMPTRTQPFTYRSARRKLSWHYQLNCYGTFFLSAPSWWKQIKTYTTWRRYLVAKVEHDRSRNAFIGADAWLNRGSTLNERQHELRQAQVLAVRAHLGSLLQGVSPRDQALIKCAVAVVCHSRQDDRGVQLQDLFSPADLGGIRIIAR